MKEVSLKHVSTWDERRGQVQVTPEEASRLFASSASYTTGKFWCDLCDQPVTFVSGGRQTPHFRHASGSKDCEDKVKGYPNYRQTNPLGFSLPVKLGIDLNRKTLDIYIGFLPLPKEKLEKAENSKSLIRLISPSGKSLSRLFIDRENFSSEWTTYHSAGNAICEHYRIVYSDNTVSLNDCWPQLIHGFDSRGTFFDAASYKRLPTNPDIEVNREYFLVIRKKNVFGPRGIEVELLLSGIENEWELYRIKALELSERVNEFFRNLGARLNKTPASIVQLWPPGIRASHTFFYESDPVFFYHKGNGYVEMESASKVFHNQDKTSEGEVHFFTNNALRQVLFVNRRFNSRLPTVLRFLVLNKQTLTSPRRFIPHVLLKDVNKNPLEPGVFHTLPPERMLEIHSDFDGFVDVFHHGRQVERFLLRSEQYKTIPVYFGLALVIYQGLDRVAEVIFERVEGKKKSEDVLFTYLSTRWDTPVSIAHEVGRFSSKLAQRQELKRRLLRCIRNGYINSRALLYLQKKGFRS